MTKRFLILVLLLLSAPATVLAASKPLTVIIDHGFNLVLSAPASSVFVANPDIADVQVMSPTSIMIFGKRTGETTFMATDSNGHTLEERTVSVTQDLSGLSRELEIAFPGNKMRAASLPNGIILTGEAKDAASVTDAFKMAQRYLPAGVTSLIAYACRAAIKFKFAFASPKCSAHSTIRSVLTGVTSAILAVLPSASPPAFLI